MALRGWRQTALGFLVVAAFTAVLVVTTLAWPANGASPLGTVSLVAGGNPSCPAGWKCQAFTVRCPGVQDSARGVMATLRPTRKPRGVVMFFSGGGGTGYWGRGQTAAAFSQSLLRDGFILVQVRWVDSWLTAARGEQVGPARLACRGASVVRWASERLYKPLKLKRKAGRCGFCITGNSGGASAVSYALSHYGLDSVLDAVIPSGGPPHAALVKGCLPGSDGYRFEPNNARTIDRSYGFLRAEGACSTGDSTFAARWQRDAVDTGGSDYVYPRTRVVFVLGGEDRTVGPAHGRDFLDRLRAAGSPRVALQEVAGMPHAISGSATGLAVLRRTLLAG